MDSLKFTPKDFNSSYADDTYNVEGYGDAVEEIRSEYPDETKTEEQQKLEDLFDPDSEINQGLLNEFDLGEDNDLQISEDLNLEEMPNLFDSEITIELSATIPPRRTRSVLSKSSISLTEINFTNALSFTGLNEDHNIQKAEINDIAIVYRAKSIK